MFNKDDKVIFGRMNGEQTKGTVLGTARSRLPKYKVRQDEARGRYPVGTIWTVAESAMWLDPSAGQASANPTAVAAPASVAAAASWRPGMRAEFTHTSGRVITGTIKKLFGSKASLVEDGNDGSRWWNIMATRLRPTTTQAPAASPEAKASVVTHAEVTQMMAARSAWKVSDRVAFETRGMTIVGMIIRVNGQTARVLPDGEKDPRRAWRVPFGLLRPQGEAKAMKYSVGQRVIVESLFGKHRLVGTVKGFNQQYQRWEVFAGGSTFRYEEKDMQPFSGKRDEVEIMADFSAAYNHLSPENLTCDGERPRSQVSARYAELQRWLRELAAEYGRMVTEEETYRWLEQRQKSGLPFRF